MLIHFRTDQTLKLISHLNCVRDWYNSSALDSEDHYHYNYNPNYSFELLNISAHVLTKISFLPTKITIDKLCEKPCVELVYRIDNITKLHIRFIPNYFFSYKTKTGEDNYAQSKCEDRDVVKWIDTLVSDLLIKEMKQYSIPV